MRKITKGLGTFVATMTIAATFATSNAEAATYTVKSGDSLWSIAQKYRTSVSSLQLANGISGHLIYPGQTIQTSGSATTTTKTTTAKTSTSSSATVSQKVLNWPAAGRLTSGFGPRAGGYHLGIDIANRAGTPIKASAAGKVTRSAYSTSYGHVVYIYHPHLNLTTVYAHLNSRYVSYGQNVSSGQTIGGMGNTGNSFGNHLHFEVHNGGWDYRSGINPMPFLK